MDDFKLAKNVKLVQMKEDYAKEMGFDKNFNKNEGRPFLYIGTINNFPMYVPLLSIQEWDYKQDGRLKPSTNMTEIIRHHKNVGLGKLNLNNAIPIPLSKIKRMDFHDDYYKQNPHKRSRLFAEIRYIKRNLDKITEKFNILYHEKVNENAYSNKQYLKHTHDFDALIEKATELSNTKRLEKLQNSMITKIEEIRFDIETLIINNCETKRENPEVLLNALQNEIDEELNVPFDPIRLNEFIKELKMMLQEEEALEETLINTGRSR